MITPSRSQRGEAKFNGSDYTYNNGQKRLQIHFIVDWLYAICWRNITTTRVLEMDFIFFLSSCRHCKVSKIRYGEREVEKEKKDRCLASVTVTGRAYPHPSQIKKRLDKTVGMRDSEPTNDQ